MTTTIKATYANGVLTPSESLDIEEGKEVTLSIEDAPAVSEGLVAIVDRIEELHRSAPEGAWDDTPPDLAMNKKHYLYGHPREEDA